VSNFRRVVRAARLQHECDEFNKLYGVGTEVDVEKDDGSIVRTKTRGPAEVLGNHTAVIWLEDIRGCYALSRVSVISAKKGVQA
jgi:hypothetical protein